jgi:hypothetical protein
MKKPYSQGVRNVVLLNSHILVLAALVLKTNHTSRKISRFLNLLGNILFKYV